MTTEIHVVVLPDEFGDLSVCDVDSLIDALVEGKTVDEAIGDASIDTLEPSDREHRDRIRALNATGNVDAYWGHEANERKH